MKQDAGSNDARINEAPAAGRAGWLPSALRLSGQSLVSKLVMLAGGLLLVAVVADAPVRAIARSLDPSARAWMQLATQFGDSSWPLGIGLTLLGLVYLLRWSDRPVPPEDLAAFRSILILLVISVAISGLLSSLAKHSIGRIRPSTDPEAMVLEFSVMAFKSGWAAFPSGHATTATAAALALALSFPRQAWAWLSVGLLAVLSRALLGAHWLSDCIAGMILGTVVTLHLHRRMVAAGHRFDFSPGGFVAIAVAIAFLLRRLAAKAGQALLHALRRTGS